jgi:hypothetical protein
MHHDLGIVSQRRSGDELQFLFEDRDLFSEE